MTCLFCGCTDERACFEGCSWVCAVPPICSRCVGALRALVSRAKLLELGQPLGQPFAKPQKRQPAGRDRREREALKAEDRKGRKGPGRHF